MIDTPFDRPILPNPMTFTPQSVPPININLPPLLQNLVPECTAALLNTAIQSASKNPGRMYTMNQLVKNNLQNPVLAGAVEFVVRRAAVLATMNNTPLNVSFYIGNAANDVAELLTSTFVVKNPEIQAVCRPDQIQAAYSNHSRGQAMLSEMQNLNMGPYLNQNYQPPQQSQQTWGNMGQSSAFFSNMPAYPGGGGMTAGSQWAQPPAPAVDLKQMSSQLVGQAENLKAAATEWGTFAWGQQAQSSAPQPASVQPTPTPQPAVLVPATTIPSNNPSQELPILTCKGQHEMDMNIHAIPYFGANDRPFDLTDRRSDLRRDALTAQQKIVEANLNQLDTFLNPKVQMDLSLSSLMMVNGRMLHKVGDDGNTRKLYRFFAIELNPFASFNDNNAIMYSIRDKCKEMGDIVGLLRSGMQSFEDPKNLTVEEMGMLNNLSYIDATLAARINYFLKYHLGISDFIESFGEDYKAILEHVGSRYGEAAHSALVTWCQMLFSNLKSSIDENSFNTIKNYISEDEEDDFSAVFVPRFYSVTMLGLTSKELGYSPATNGSLIDPRTTPVLSDICIGLDRNKRDLGYNTDTDLLVAADGLRYVIASDFRTPGAKKLFAYNQR